MPSKYTDKWNIKYGQKFFNRIILKLKIAHCPCFWALTKLTQSLLLFKTKTRAKNGQK